MNTDVEINLRIAEWVWGYKTDIRVLTHDHAIMVDLQEGKYLSLPWFTESVKSWLDYVSPVLIERGYEPSMNYDIDIHMWSIGLRSTHSNCSIDSPVEYCGTKDIAWTLCGLTMQVIRQGVKA